MVLYTHYNCTRFFIQALPVGSRVAFHIGESSGEDDDDPNVATGDGRAPPQGSTAPRWWGTSDGRGATTVVVRVVTRRVAAWW